MPPKVNKGALNVTVKKQQPTKNRRTRVQEPEPEETEDEDELDRDGDEEEEQDGEESEEDDSRPIVPNGKLQSKRQSVGEQEKELSELEARLVNLKREKRKREEEILVLTAGKVCRIDSNGKPVRIEKYRGVDVNEESESNNEEEKLATATAVRLTRSFDLQSYSKLLDLHF